MSSPLYPRVTDDWHNSTQQTNTNTNTKTHTDAHAHAHAHVYECVYGNVYVDVYVQVLETDTRSKKSMKPLEGQRLRTADFLSTAQDSTAHDSTPQRNPPFLLSLLSSLIPFYQMFHARKCPNYCRPGNHYRFFSGIRGSFARSGLLVAGILDENKKPRLVIIITPMVPPSRRPK